MVVPIAAKGSAVVDSVTLRNYVTVCVTVGAAEGLPLGESDSHEQNNSRFEVTHFHFL
jgi:hypothetical protein